MKVVEVAGVQDLDACIVLAIKWSDRIGAPSRYGIIR
jgi:hypothetical protein